MNSFEKILLFVNAKMAVFGGRNLTKKRNWLRKVFLNGTLRVYDKKQLSTGVKDIRRTSEVGLSAGLSQGAAADVCIFAVRSLFRQQFGCKITIQQGCKFV